MFLRVASKKFLFPLKRKALGNVMMESVGAACHHFAQPLTTMLSYLQMLAKGEGIEGSPKSLMFEQCPKAARI